VGGICSTYGGEERCIQGFSGEEGHLEDPGVNGIILRWIFRTWDVRAWTGSMWHRIATGGGLFWMRQWSAACHNTDRIVAAMRRRVEQDKQCNIVSRSPNQCRSGKAIIPSVCFTELHVLVNYIKISNFPQQCSLFFLEIYVAGYNTT